MNYNSLSPGEKFSLFLFLMLSSFGLRAANPPTDSLEHALLWRITAPDMTDTSYLFGTIHVIGEEDFFLPKGFEEAFAKCDKVVFEIDLEKAMSPFNMIGLMGKMTMEGDTTLEDLLSEEDYALVSKRMKDQGMPMFMIKNWKPIFILFFLQQDQVGAGLSDANEEGMEATTSYEMELLRKAQESGKEMDGLETASFQMSLFDKIPYSEQADLLRDALHEEEASEEEKEASPSMEALIATYKAQDVDSLAAMLLLQDEFTRKYSDLFVVGRNKNWISGMQKLMAEGPVFFAVGAGHLGGEQGVVRLLRAAGYRVSAVQP